MNVELITPDFSNAGRRRPSEERRALRPSAIGAFDAPHRVNKPIPTLTD